MRHRARLLATGIALAWLTVAPWARQTPPAQTPQKPGQATVFRSTVDLVQVDVVVVDQDGTPIKGLKKDDFALFDRKKPQTIATFDEISHDSDINAADAAAAANLFPVTLKKDVASNKSAQSDRLVVLLVDDLHIYQGRTDKAKDLAKQILNQLGPQASMAVLFTSGNNSTEVTEDRAQLLAAVETLKGRQSWRRPHQSIDKQVGAISQSDTKGGRGNSDSRAIHQQIDVLQQASLQEFEENLVQYKTMEDAARLLGGDDARRKAFVLLSEGIGKDLTGMFDSEVTPCEVTCPPGAICPCYHDNALREMMESMRRSSVATYNIDPRGHVTAQQLAIEAFPSLVSGLGDDPASGGFRWDNPIRQAQEGLKIMAEASGGFAVTDTDDYEGGLKRIIEDIDHYYLLGFYPADPNGKLYRPLDVWVTAHPEWRVRFRKGYMPGGPPPPPKNTDPLVALSAGVMPKTDLPLRLTAVPLPGINKLSGAVEKTARVVASLEITAPSKSLVEADAKLRDEVSYELLVIDDKKAKVMTRTGQAARMVLHGREGGGDMPDFLIYQVEATLDLLPGRYDLRASAISTKLGKGGSVYFTVDVPDFTSAPLMLSGLTIGYADGAHVPVGRNTSTQPAPPPAPTSKSATGGKSASTPPPTSAPAPAASPVPPVKVLPFDVALDREFTTFDTLRVYCELARAKVTEPVKVTVEMVDAADKVRLTAERDVPPTDAGHLDLDLRLNDLDSGPYRVRVVATAGAQTARREIGVIVR